MGLALVLLWILFEVLLQKQPPETGSHKGQKKLMMQQMKRIVIPVAFFFVCDLFIIKSLAISSAQIFEL